jgi:HK97 family phage prohead protease
MTISFISGNSMTEIKYAGVTFEVKADDVKPDGSFKGYGATFGNVDLGGDICDEKCFDKTLKEMSSKDAMPAMFASHDSREPIGEWNVMGTDKRGLYMEGNLWLGAGIQKAEQHYRQMRSRGPKGLSIGYITQKAVPDEKKPGVRRLMEVDLLEVSPTPFPMNPKARITGVKSVLEGKTTIDIRSAEKILRDAGLSSDEAKHFLSCLKAGIDAERDAEREVIEALNSLRNNLITKG